MPSQQMQFACAECCPDRDPRTLEIATIAQVRKTFLHCNADPGGEQRATTKGTQCEQPQAQPPAPPAEAGQPRQG